MANAAAGGLGRPPALTAPATPPRCRRRLPRLRRPPSCASESGAGRGNRSSCRTMHGAASSLPAAARRASPPLCAAAACRLAPARLPPTALNALSALLLLQVRDHDCAAAHHGRRGARPGAAQPPTQAARMLAPPQATCCAPAALARASRVHAAQHPSLHPPTHQRCRPLQPATTPQELAKFQAFLQKHGATMLSDMVRGRQRLAYPIKR